MNCPDKTRSVVSSHSLETSDTNLEILSKSENIKDLELRHNLFRIIIASVNPEFYPSPSELTGSSEMSKQAGRGRA